jgi:hypothetical protein
MNYDNPYRMASIIPYKHQPTGVLNTAHLAVSVNWKRPVPLHVSRHVRSSLKGKKYIYPQRCHQTWLADVSREIPALNGVTAGKILQRRNR